jgi:hypothetical protein
LSDSKTLAVTVNSVPTLAEKRKKRKNMWGKKNKNKIKKRKKKKITKKQIKKKE